LADSRAPRFGPAVHANAESGPPFTSRMTPETARCGEAAPVDILAQAYRKHGAETSTTNRETSALSRMFQLAVRRGQLDRMPIFPKRLEENRHARASSNTRNTRE
jgi:hypothetical protein